MSVAIVISDDEEEDIVCLPQSLSSKHTYMPSDCSNKTQDLQRYNLGIKLGQLLHFSLSKGASPDLHPPLEAGHSRPHCMRFSVHQRHLPPKSKLLELILLF